MKIMKKLLALVMALTLVMGTAAAAAAAAEGDLAHDKGSITITGGLESTTYNIYRILDLASFSDPTPEIDGTGHYVYRLRQPNSSLSGEEKAADDQKVLLWNTFIQSDAIRGKYLTLTDNDHQYVEWVTGASAENFAKLAIQYAKDNGIAADATASYALDSTDNVMKAKAENLRLGYYLVDSTQGTLCNLTSTNLDITIADKNPPHTQDKKVIEDSLNTLGKNNDADYNQNVHFETAVTLQRGGDKVVYHDAMSSGLELKSDSIAVKIGSSGKLLTLGTDYDVELGGEPHDHNGQFENCTFRVVFKQPFLDSISVATNVLISYDATLLPSATTYNAETNDSIVSWGDKYWTEASHTNTYTFGFQVFKYETDSGESKPLADAEFVLKNVGNSEYNGKYAVWAKQPDNMDADGKVLNAVYKFVKWTDNMNDVVGADQQIIIKTDATGTFDLQGLDRDSYELIETLAPDGYERLDQPVRVTLDSEAQLLQDNKKVDRVSISNTAGSLLPSTGGNGVYFYYVLGTILMLGAAVLLITKRRMSVN